jgi:hypothetical protein
MAKWEFLEYLVDQEMMDKQDPKEDKELLDSQAKEEDLDLLEILDLPDHVDHLESWVKLEGKDQ